MSEAYVESLNLAKEEILKKLSLLVSKPRVLIICGSGLGGIADKIDQSTAITISYDQIPGFKVSTGK